MRVQSPDDESLRPLVCRVNIARSRDSALDVLIPDRPIESKPSNRRRARPARDANPVSIARVDALTPACTRPSPPISCVCRQQRGRRRLVGTLHAPPYRPYVILYAVGRVRMRAVAYICHLLVNKSLQSRKRSVTESRISSNLLYIS